MTQQKNCPVTRCQAITNLINSVAKEQEALADILEKVKNKPGSGKDFDCYSDYSDDSSSDTRKKDDRQLKLVNAVARIEFILAFKTSIFLDCACPKDGCKENERHN